MGQEKLPSAVDVAKYILWLAAVDPELLNPSLTDKQLQKILYYVQGYSLGRRDCPVFQDQIRAWREGPVVQSVYDFFKASERKEFDLNIDDSELPPLTKAFVAAVWEDLKGYSERELIERTHSETPWIVARGRYKSHEPSDVPIRDTALREFFSQSSINSIRRDDLRKMAAASHPAESWFEEPDPFGA